MSNYQFLLKYTRLLERFMFQELTDLRFGVLSHSKTDSSIYWNITLVDQVLTDDQISIVEKEMAKLNRNPAIYFENRDELLNLKKELIKNGNSKKVEDCWMFHSGEDIDEADFDKVKKVSSEEELKTFIETFDVSYQKDDPQNPYGQLGDYLKLAERSWQEFHSKGQEYFIAYDDDKPVAVATLSNFEGLGYISNVGSLREVRGKGFGKLVTLYCLSASKRNDNAVHCLATEEGTYPHQFYQRLGFQTKFTGLGFGK